LREEDLCTGEARIFRDFSKNAYFDWAPMSIDGLLDAEKELDMAWLKQTDDCRLHGCFRSPKAEEAAAAHIYKRNISKVFEGLTTAEARAAPAVVCALFQTTWIVSKTKSIL
jgi:hypothetical protein